jgi:hypothetical protein
LKMPINQVKMKTATRRRAKLIAEANRWVEVKSSLQDKRAQKTRETMLGTHDNANTH